MDHQGNLVAGAAGIVLRNKRYIVWFFLLNLLFAHFGAQGLSPHVHAILDHSLYADKLLHGFDVTVFFELTGRPEFGPEESSTTSATIFAVLFFLASMVFMPGVLLGYSFDHRISRNEFFRACSQNLWRFVRLFLIFAVIAGIVAGFLFGIQAALTTAAEKALDERLPFFVQTASMIVIFLVMTSMRIWFDLAQTDVVLRDEGAVRKSVMAAWVRIRHNLGRLLGSYVVIALAALLILIAGMWLWQAIVPPSSVLGAFLISQATLFMLLAMRFWQRAVAVAFYVREPWQAIEKVEGAALAAASAGH